MLSGALTLFTYTQYPCWVSNHELRSTKLLSGQRICLKGKGMGPRRSAERLRPRCGPQDPVRTFGLSVTSGTTEHCCRQHVHFSPWRSQGGKNPWQDFSLGLMASSKFDLLSGQILRVSQIVKMLEVRVVWDPWVEGGWRWCSPLLKALVALCCSNERGGTLARLFLSGYWSRALCLTAWTSDGILSFSLNSTSLFLNCFSMAVYCIFEIRKQNLFCYLLKLNPL